MILSILRRSCAPLALIAALTTAVPLPTQILAAQIPVAQIPVAASSTAVQAAPSVPWLYVGSDIPPDPAWTFGELPNGLRYALRRSGVPPRQVSIRVAIDAGSLAESDNERGYAHFLEHLSFRGSRYVSDGEAKRVWQRLGATFGSDTNAVTSPTQTIYKLDLPSVTRAGLDESLHILSGMMASPAITPANVDAERRTVLAEQRERNDPGSQARDAMFGLFFEGQPLATRISVIGTTASLTNATAPTLKAFHDRWYRPDKTLIVIAGDVDPTSVEPMLRQHFGDWRGEGPATPMQSFGQPEPDGQRTAAVSAPGLPLMVNLAVMRPWVQQNDTVEFNRGRLTLGLAARIINRRLETRARAGASYSIASIDQDEIARSADATMIQIIPAGTDWEAAVRDVRAVLADAIAKPPSKAEIKREAAEFDNVLNVGVETEAVETSNDLADSVVEAVNIRETVASAVVARDVFAGMGKRLTPAAMQKASQMLLSGTPMRGFVASPEPLPDGQARLLTAITAPVAAATIKRNTRSVSFSHLPRLGKPGVIEKVFSTPEGEINLTLARFRNDTRALIYANGAESGRVSVAVRFGHGYGQLPKDRPTVAWAGESVISRNGIGKLTEDDMDSLTSARSIGMDFDITDDAFVLTGATRRNELRDQLRLLATKIAYPGWQPAPVERMRTLMLASYPEGDVTPNGVLQRQMMQLLRGGDPRWASPDQAQIAAVTPEALRALFEPIMASGPIEVSVWGDVDPKETLQMIADTFGALPPRPDAEVAPDGLAPSSVIPNATPLVLRHRGAEDQAIGLIAWPTSGGIAEIAEARRLDVLAEIFSDRLFERLREHNGASYAPSVESQWPERMRSGGNFVVMAPLKPQGVRDFFVMSDAIAADLAKNPVSADELARAVGPMREMLLRVSTSNGFWMNALAGMTSNPQLLDAVSTQRSDLEQITPETLRATAERWLIKSRQFRLEVLPQNAPAVN